MDLCNEACLSGQLAGSPPCVAKTLMLDNARKLYKQLFVRPTILISAIYFYHFIPLSLTLILDGFFYLLVDCLAFHQRASVSLGLICSDKFTYCHTEIEFAHQTFYLTQSQYTDTRPASPNTDRMTSGAWQGGHSSTNS